MKQYSIICTGKKNDRSIQIGNWGYGRVCEMESEKRQTSSFRHQSMPLPGPRCPCRCLGLSIPIFLTVGLSPRHLFQDLSGDSFLCSSISREMHTVSFPGLSVCGEIKFCADSLQTLLCFPSNSESSWKQAFMSSGVPSNLIIYRCKNYAKKTGFSSKDKWEKNSGGWK